MSRDPDSVAISVVVLLTTMPVVIATVLSDRAFSGGATICLALSALGVGDHLYPLHERRLPLTRG